MEGNRFFYLQGCLLSVSALGIQAFLCALFWPPLTHLCHCVIVTNFCWLVRFTPLFSAKSLLTSWVTRSFLINLKISASNGSKIAKSPAHLFLSLKAVRITNLIDASQFSLALKDTWKCPYDLSNLLPKHVSHWNSSRQLAFLNWLHRLCTLNIHVLKP